MTPAPYPSLAIRFAVETVGGDAFALVDTGFEGHLVVPESLTGTLPRPIYARRVRTASGEIVPVPVYLGTVELLDQPGAVEALIIALGDEYLIGIEPLNHFAVTFDHGQRVIVDP